MPASGLPLTMLGKVSAVLGDKLAKARRNLERRRNASAIAEEIAAHLPGEEEEGTRWEGDTEMYNEEALIKREQLFELPTIRRCLELWWSATKADLDTDHNGILDKEEYRVLHSRLEQAVVEADDDGKELSSEEANLSFEEDWLMDSKGEDFIDKELFVRSIFQLVDQWCETAEEWEYNHYLRVMYAKVFNREFPDDENVDLEEIDAEAEEKFGMLSPNTARAKRQQRHTKVDLIPKGFSNPAWAEEQRRKQLEREQAKQAAIEQKQREREEREREERERLEKERQELERNKREQQEQRKSSAEVIQQLEVQTEELLANMEETEAGIPQEATAYSAPAGGTESGTAKLRSEFYKQSERFTPTAKGEVVKIPSPIKEPSVLNEVREVLSPRKEKEKQVEAKTLESPRKSEWQDSKAAPVSETQDIEAAAVQNEFAPAEEFAEAAERAIQTQPASNRNIEKLLEESRVSSLGEQPEQANDENSALTSAVDEEVAKMSILCPAKNVKTSDTQTQWADVAAADHRPPSQSWTTWMPPPRAEADQAAYMRYHSTVTPVPPSSAAASATLGRQQARLQVAALPISQSTCKPRRPGTAGSRGSSRKAYLRLTHKTFVSCYGERMSADALGALQSRLQRQQVHSQNQERMKLPTLERLSNPKHSCKPRPTSAASPIMAVSNASITKYVLEHKRKGVNMAWFSRGPAQGQRSNSNVAKRVEKSDLAKRSVYKHIGTTKPRSRPAQDNSTFGLFPVGIKMAIA